MDGERLLMATDAAKLLRRSAELVRYYSRLGRLPTIRTANGTRIFRESDVLRLAAELAAKDQEKPGAVARGQGR